MPTDNIRVQHGSVHPIGVTIENQMFFISENHAQELVDDLTWAIAASKAGPNAEYVKLPGKTKFNWKALQIPTDDSVDKVLDEYFSRKKEKTKKLSPYPSWCCQKCGAQIGWVGRVLIGLHRCEKSPK